jgi:hypothetical protein
MPVGETPGFEPPDLSPYLVVSPKFDPGPAVLVRDCPHRERCGCQVPRCHAGKGDAEGGARATYAHCLKCVGGPQQSSP